MPKLEADELAALSTVLNYLDTWPLRHPRLTRAVAERARATGCWAQVGDALSARMHPSSWGGFNGESPELGNALRRAQEAAAQTVDPELRTAYEQAAERIQATIDSDRRRHEEDSQSGWD